MLLRGRISKKLMRKKNDIKGNQKSLKQLEKELYKYTIYLRKLVTDLKKRNYPLSKKYYKIPKLLWSKYRKWYLLSVDAGIQEKIDWNVFLYAVYRDLKQQDFFKKMSTKISSISKNEEKFLFENYVEKILHIFFYEEDKGIFSIKNLVKYLIVSIKNEQPVVITTSFLSGILIDKDKIVIDKNLKIRKATKKDFESSISLDYYYDYDRVVENCFCILEYAYRKESKYFHSWDVLRKIEIILQLFKLSSADCIGTIEKSSDMTDFSHGTYQHGFYYYPGLPYYAKIKENEIKYLRRFYRLMQKRLTRSIVNYFTENNELEIALSRYMNGLKSVHLINISVSYAVMAVEALLIKSGGDQKLRFALHSSRLLGLIGLNPKKVYQNMLIAYDVRSKYVHGDKMSRKTENAIKKRFKNKEKFGFTIMDYARLIITIYIILNKTKDELYDILEEVEFEKGGKQLKKEIKSVNQYLKLDNYKPKFKMWPQSDHYITV